MTASNAFDPMELETKVKAMYRSVAENPHGDFHFEMGRAMAERLGYPPADLDPIPDQAIESFAGVGYYFHLARLQEGETVLDLGSGSGKDTFFASHSVNWQPLSFESVQGWNDLSGLHACCRGKPILPPR